MTSFRKLLLGTSLCMIALAGLPVHAQIGGVNGLISGTVADSSGAPISGAHVTATGTDGVVHSTDSTGDGSFSLLNLATGNYRLTATAPGFAAYTHLAIMVAVGRNAQLSIVMHPAGTRQTVTVNAQTSTLDISQTSSVTNIDKDRVEELPVQSRNYLAFTLLAPQIAPANPAIAQQTLTQGSNGFSFGGLRPNSNAIYIDGVDDDDEYTGASRTELSPEAISDFQIVNHGYEAQSGGAAGGSIDVQTRSGVALQHGDAFIFVQNGALNANPPLERVPYKPDESRIRAGISNGGALGKEAFYYVAGEQEYARGEDANDISPSTITQINRDLKQMGPLHSLSLQGGFIPTTEQETEFSARVDGTLTSREALMLRYALTNNRDVNDAFNADDLHDQSARGSAFYADNSLNGTLTSTFSSTLLNRLSFEASQRRAVTSTHFTAGPGVVIPGIIQFGTPYAGNDRRFEIHSELDECLLRQYGKHLFQLGAGIDHIGLRSENRDGFRGLYVFQDLAALTSSTSDFYIQSFGNPDTNFAEVRGAAYAQDHWAPSHSLAIDYGLRYEFNRLPGTLPQHSVNFSPRVGVAYSPSSSWVIRSGFGIFYDRFQLSTINRLLEFNGAHALTQTIESTSAATFYRSGAQFSQPHPGIAPSIWRAQQGLANPYSEVASLGIERALPLGWTAKAEYQFVHGVKLGRTTNVNLLPPVTLTTENAVSLGVPVSTLQQLGRSVFTPARSEAEYDVINQFATEAGSTYNGATFTLNRQFDEQFELMAGYTYSKTIDDASFDLEQPENPYAPGSERALSLQDQRHRLTLNGLWVLGPDLDDLNEQAGHPSGNSMMRDLTGLEIAPIFTATSGFHANAITGQDSNLEHVYPFAARPLGYARNALKTAPNVSFDLRILKMVPIWRGHLDVVAESFNLLNHTNISLLNTTYGSESRAASNFKTPIAASAPRRMQFSLDFEY